jgi:hypothetical protein
MICNYRHKILMQFLMFGALSLISSNISAQRQLRNYIVKDGKMYIELGRDLSEGSVDSFITQFNLADIGLKQFFKKRNPDSLLKSGWAIEMNNETGFIISKRFMAVNLKFPGDKVSFAEMFPEGQKSGIDYGYNRFKNSNPFSVKDSIVYFFLRNNVKADHVILAGSFNNWSTAALEMTRTDSGWIAPVKLGPGKYWYKFIIDGRWSVDNDNILRENDGRGNINSIFYRSNFLFTLNGHQNAKKVFVAGSFNRWRPAELQMIRTASGWELPLYLAEGTHTYKFVVDGAWYEDEKNPLHLPDGNGGFNSVIRLGTPYVFKLNGYTNAQRVVLAGSFNGWREDELQMNKTSGGWELPYTLGAGNYEYRFLVDGQWVTDPANKLKGSNGNSYLIINPNYTFRLKGFNDAQAVFLAGDFNEFNPSSFSMRKQSGEWVFDIHLTPGKHLYKFVVDGKWIIDPANKLWEQNEYGTGNSVIWMDQGN